MDSKTLDDLQDGLQRWARGAYDCEAAIIMLTETRLWSKLANELMAHHAIGRDDDGRPWIDVDCLPAVADSALSGGERRVLNLVCSFLGVDSPPLASMLSSLDDEVMFTFLRASAHLSGWHERGLTLEKTVVVPGPWLG
jgi:hypothetical protein